MAVDLDGASRNGGGLEGGEGVGAGLGGAVPKPAGLAVELPESLDEVVGLFGGEEAAEAAVVEEAGDAGGGGAEGASSGGHGLDEGEGGGFLAGGEDDEVGPLIFGEELFAADAAEEADVGGELEFLDEGVEADVVAGERDADEVAFEGEAGLLEEGAGADEQFLVFPFRDDADAEEAEAGAVGGSECEEFGVDGVGDGPKASAGASADVFIDVGGDGDDVAGAADGAALAEFADGHGELAWVEAGEAGGFAEDEAVDGDDVGAGDAGGGQEVFGGGLAVDDVGLEGADAALEGADFAEVEGGGLAGRAAGEVVVAHGSPLEGLFGGEAVGEGEDVDGEVIDGFEFAEEGFGDFGDAGDGGFAGVGHEAEVGEAHGAAVGWGARGLRRGAGALRSGGVRSAPGGG